MVSNHFNYNSNKNLSFNYKLQMTTYNIDY